MGKINLVLVSSRDFVRAGFVNVLSGMDFRVTGCDPAEVVVPDRHHPVDVVLVDACDDDGVTTATVLLETIDRPVLGLVDDPERESTLLELGIAGCVRLDWRAPCAAQVLRSVVGAHMPRPFGPFVPGDPEPDPALGGPHGDRTASLTRRELDVLRLVASGLSNQAVAQTLFLSVNSVKSHIRSTYRKIGVVSRSQAVVWCYENGIAAVTA